MLIIQPLSDLHLEFAPYDLVRTGADVLVLAGDIGTGSLGVRAACRWAVEYDLQVVMVLGNHEYYHRTWKRQVGVLKRVAARWAPGRVHVLENEEVVIGGTLFLGTTLWTDFRLYEHGSAGGMVVDRPRAMRNAEMIMNDYNLIRKPRGRLLGAGDTLDHHVMSRWWLERALTRPFDGPTVVVTHHAPSVRSRDPRRDGGHVASSAGDPAYMSDLEALMGPNIDLWVHGHTHYSVDYNVNGTRVVSNARGYPKERLTHDPRMTVEISGAPVGRRRRS